MYTYTFDQKKIDDFSSLGIGKYFSLTRNGSKFQISSQKAFSSFTGALDSKLSNPKCTVEQYFLQSYQDELILRQRAVPILNLEGQEIDYIVENYRGGVIHSGTDIFGSATMVEIHNPLQEVHYINSIDDLEANVIQLSQPTQEIYDEINHDIVLRKIKIAVTEKDFANCISYRSNIADYYNYKVLESEFSSVPKELLLPTS